MQIERMYSEFLDSKNEDYKKKYTAELMTKKYFNLIINE